MWSKADFRAIPEIAENPQMPVCQGVPAFWLRQVGWMPIRSQTRRDTNFAIPGYSFFCHYTTARGKNKVFSVCGHSCGQSRFCAAFGNRGKSRKCRCHKALRRFALPCPGYRHGTPKQCAVSRTAHGRSRKTAAAMGAAFASRRERLSKQRHYNRQVAEKQERESGNSLFCEFRLYGGLDFCYNAENVRKAGTVYANEKKKQSGAADGGV